MIIPQTSFLFAGLTYSLTLQLFFTSGTKHEMVNIEPNTLKEKTEDQNAFLKYLNIKQIIIV